MSASSNIKRSSLSEVRESLPTSPTAANITSNTNLVILAHKNDFYNILKESQNRLLLIEFFANWCGPCQTLAEKLEQLAEAYNGKILVVKVDVDEFEDLALEYDVSAMPTFMLMKNQQKLEQFASSNQETLNKNLEKYAGKPDGQDEEKENKTEDVVKEKSKQKRVERN